MDIEPIKQYIRQQQQFGTPITAIHAALLQTGWPAEAVDRAFNEVNNQQAISSPPPTLNTSPEPQGQTYQQPVQTTEEIPATKSKRYGVFNAIGDSLQAAGSNTATLIISTVIGLLSATLLVLSSGAILGLFGLSTLGIGSIFGIAAGVNTFIVTIIATSIVLMLVQMLSYTVMLVTVSRPIYDGAAGKSTSIKESLINSLSQLGRVFGATILSYAVIVGPMIVVSLISLAMIIADPSAATLFGIGIFATGVWALIATLRFALAPYVILFEPDLPIRKSLSRSKKLLKSGGQWFIFKGALLVLAVTVIFTTAIDTDTGLNDVASSIFSLILLIVINGVMVMLYKHLTAVENVQKPSNDPSSSPVGTFTEYPSSTS